MQEKIYPASTFPKNEEVLDNRMKDILHLFDAAPLDGINTILDIGAGQGQLAKYFARLGKKVTCTGVHIKSYISDVSELRINYGVEYVECDIDNMPFPDASFDAVVMSHVLEHCPNVSSALMQARRVLREDGLLFVFVPPAEDFVCGGHISVGWNVGQLMYVLLLNGFDVQKGSFIEYGYNVCAFVRRTERVLPCLRFDQGDIKTIADAGLFPAQIGNLLSDHFNGHVKSINWPNISEYSFGSESSFFRRIIYSLIILIIPNSFKLNLANFLSRTGRLLIKLSN